MPFDLPSDRSAPAGSMAERIRDALAETPRVRDEQRQQALTESFLAPVLPALETLLLDLRRELDPRLRAAQPARGAQPYPLGQCREITVAVRQRLAELDPGELRGPAAEAFAALQAFQAAGGEVRRAWGDLRNRYFQNALIVGTLYVDVANDTVDPRKPPVEILPFAEAGFSPIADYMHFARIARGYWNCRFWPNHVLPQLAPYLPLIMISATGRLRLEPSTGFMLALTLSKGFAPSEQALAAPALSPATFASLSAALNLRSTPVATDAEAGRAEALAWRRTYRAEGRAHCAASFGRAVAAGREANRQRAAGRDVPGRLTSPGRRARGPSLRPSAAGSRAAAGRPCRGPRRAPAVR